MTDLAKTKYQLFAYSRTGTALRGIRLGDVHYNLDDAVETAGYAALPGTNLDDLMAIWDSVLEIVEKLVVDLTTDQAALPGLNDIDFLSPLEAPGAIYGAGANYRDHVEAMARAFNMRLVLDPIAEGVDPWHFIKPGRSTVIGHNAELPFPADTERLDWEAELAVIIGRPAHKVSDKKALSFVAGYTCANDLSARDKLVRGTVDTSSPFKFDWVGHKCFAGSCPLGPYITPSKFIPDPENLGIRLTLNHEVMQDSNTNNHLYGVAEQISFLSQRFTLFPGDVILTGTPAGVGMERGVFLKPGDTMTVSIDEIGDLVTRLV